MIKKGFTLVELLAVFVLLAIIFMIAAPNMFRLIRESKAKSFLVSVRQIVKSGNEYRLADLRNKSKKCVYFDFGEDYQIDTLVNNKLYVPIEELTLRGDLPIEGEMEVCRDYVSITVSDGDNTVDIDPDGEEHVFEGNLEESNVSHPIIDSINTSKDTKSITTTITAHDDKNDIVKYYYYLNGELKQSINNKVYEFTNLKDNKSYKIKIVVENSKGLKASKDITVKTNELPEPEITVNKTGWQKQKTVTIAYPSGNNLSYQYKINSGEITGTDEKGTWLTTTSRTKYIYYTSEGSISAKVSDGFNENVVTYNVVEVDSVVPEVTVEPTVVEGENGWVTMASIKGTITKKGPSPTKLYRCRSASSSSSVSICTPTASEDNIVEDGSSLVLSSSSNYQKVCYQAMSETGMKSSVVCSDVYHVDTGPTIVANTDEVKVCLTAQNNWIDNFLVSYGPSLRKNNECMVEGNYLKCEVTGQNGKKVNASIKTSPIGCYVNYTPDNATWDALIDGVEESDVKTSGIFNIYDKTLNEDGNEIGSANGKNKNESITCVNSSYKNVYSGWRIFSVNNEKKQIMLIHGGTSECYYSYNSNRDNELHIGMSATSFEDEGTGKAWTKYGNSTFAESVHYMNGDDWLLINTVDGTESGNELSKCVLFGSESCGRRNSLSRLDSYYFIYDYSLFSWSPYSDMINYSKTESSGLRPVIVLKPNVKLGQESGLLGDEYSLITS